MNETDTKNHLNLTVPALRFDWTDWLPYLEDQDISDGEKRALIETLWSVIVAFVDLGWQIKSTSEISGSGLDLKSILEAVDMSNGEEV